MYIIIYDFGTSSVKTCLFKIDEGIRLVASSSAAYGLYISGDGGAEQDTEEWWNALSQTTKDLFKKSDVVPEEIEGLAFCSQMQGTVLVDKDGNAVRPPMNYLDQKGVKEYKECMGSGIIKVSGCSLYKLVRNLLVNYAGSVSVKDPVWKYKWVENNEPDVFRRVYKWLDIPDYLVERCTGKIVRTADSAFGTFLYDTRKGKEGWNRGLLKMYKVHPEHMPDIIDCTDKVGGLTKKAAETFGLKFVSPDVDHFGKFPRSMVEKYFAVDIWDPEANEENTLMVPNLVILYKTKFYVNLRASLDVDSIAPGFREEMDEYYDAVLGGKKTLGILIRGTDYISSGLWGIRKMATVEQMTPKIHQWMEEYGYEKLFLATEDADILAAMRKEFGKKLIALSQKRLTVSNLRTGQIISEYEKETGGEDYNAKLEDTTINYFYALYILSRCDAFLCSGQCNGWDNVLSLNDGRFERSYKFTVGVTGDPMTEDWKEIRPITAGMFARAAYPSDKAFFMTYRFDLKEAVDPDALKAAWEKTLTVYPYMGYAVVPRDKRLLLTENPLPFVFRETGEIIEPFERSGNFHMVTFCYLGQTLWIYIDHVPVDGTGINHVFETFFYHYYCIVDSVEYPVPDGVFTEKDGPVPGQDVDGYLQADAVDPTSIMGNFGGDDSFTVPECPKEGVYANRADCRAYCLSVPSAELIPVKHSIHTTIL